jgi:predicted lactoylglutathione lyase
MKQVWLNLPVKDIEKSKKFYRDIGFRENPRHEKANHLGSFLIGENDFTLMLFPEATLSGYTGKPVPDSSKTSQMLINLDAASKEEVDTFAETVKQAGGDVYYKPTEVEGWMYISSFADLDGHRWSMLYMDLDKIPK